MKHIHRRSALAGGFALAGAAAFVSMPVFRSQAKVAVKDLAATLADLEVERGGRLGVAVLDLADGSIRGHRLDERFALCSTFKWLAAAAILKRVDDGKEDLGRRVTYKQSDLVEYSPVTGEHVAGGMTIAEICEAAITLSDNTAGNLMLASLGGPEGFTRFCRDQGDEVTRLDRWETDLNVVEPHDERDSTSPRATAQHLARLVLGDALTEGSRRQLESWLLANKTGGKRLKAGLPQGWTIGDKTGTNGLLGGAGVGNDIGILYPPERRPIIVASYLVEVDYKGERLDAVHAEVGRIVSGA